MLNVELNVGTKVDLVQDFVVKGCVVVKVTMTLAVKMHVIYVLTFIVAQTKIYTSHIMFSFSRLFNYLNTNCNIKGYLRRIFL